MLTTRSTATKARYLIVTGFGGDPNYAHLIVGHKRLQDYDVVRKKWRRWANYG